MASCPGRDAAFFMPLRRTGTVPSSGVWYGPGSAAHHAAKKRRAALRPGHVCGVIYANTPRFFAARQLRQ
jgi:hypothetical protein